jgi:hypothetical protein
MDRHNHIHPDRLLGAADALLRAMDSEEGDDAAVNVWVGRTRRPAADAGTFTLGEYIEAMTMLIRLGCARSTRTAH